MLCETWTCCKVSCVVCEVKTPSLPCITKFKLSSLPLLLIGCVVWTMCEVQTKGIDLLVLCEVKTLSLPCFLDSNYLHHFCLWLVFELCEALTCYRVSCVVCEVETPSLPCLSKSKSSSSTLLCYVNRVWGASWTSTCCDTCIVCEVGALSSHLLNWNCFIIFVAMNLFLGLSMVGWTKTQQKKILAKNPFCKLYNVDSVDIGWW